MKHSDLTRSEPESLLLKYLIRITYFLHIGMKITRHFGEVTRLRSVEVRICQAINFRKGQTDGRTGGWKDGRTDGRTDGRMEGH